MSDGVKRSHKHDDYYNVTIEHTDGVMSGRLSILQYKWGTSASPAIVGDSNAGSTCRVGRGFKVHALLRALLKLQDFKEKS
ncbi:hypothetical protein EYF80_016135 [Liparis tanakae]|uniref:Uncharacterized protein n=1 Tax=Liparis tanakae TaxID=230148 RepID=A0A4Z2I6U5_9TELE|nr:hypothetical protein EYF80_016135 [Liparis tanakae]